MYGYFANHKYKIGVAALALVLTFTIIGLSVGASKYNNKKSKEVHDNLFPCRAIGCCGVYCAVVNITYNHNITFQNDTYSFDHDLGPCNTFLKEYGPYPLYCQRLNHHVYTTEYYESFDWVFDHVWLFIFLIAGILLCGGGIVMLCMNGWSEIVSPCTGYQQLHSEV